MSLSDFFNFFKREKNSKERAKERLKFALVYDRLNLSTETVENIKREFIEVLKKYLDIDEDHLDFRIVNEERETAIVANIPLKLPRKKK